jgi:putative hydrolase of the HAD superfamily
MVLTKGDLFDQESKLARSGIGSCFEHVEIVSEKDEQTYRRIITRYGLQPHEFLMIGNSLKSDILPVLDAGGHAIHIPYHTTAHHERVSGDGYTYKQVERIQDVVVLLQS